MAPSKAAARKVKSPQKPAPKKVGAPAKSPLGPARAKAKAPTPKLSEPKAAKAPVSKKPAAGPAKEGTRPPARPAPTGAEKAPAPAAKPEKKAAGKGASAIPAPTLSAPTRRSDGWGGPLPDKPLPRRTKLPAEVEPLTPREMEQVLTVGARGVTGEGPLKGRLLVYQGFPYLEVIGRDKRELWFLLQGPDQEVLPAYVDHRVSVSGLIRKHHNYGGSVDVRKWSAKKVEAEAPAVAEPVVEENRLRLFSPGEVETLGQPGMSVGQKGYATLRGRLEMSGDEFYLVVSNPGTRQQVAFTLEGKAQKGLKKYVGEIMVATGVIEKLTGWGGTIQAELCEPRAPEYPPVARDTIELTQVEGASSAPRTATLKLNNGLVVRLPERQGYVWSIEPAMAKRLSLREVNLDPDGPVREFFFTPRNPGVLDVDFFLAKTHNPMQVSKQFRLTVEVKPLDLAMPG
ncbi:MAG: transcriptional regulator [Myxococcaceae bacterium]|nr:transcriptional regulator [Myxococcaceae bacterium]MCA3014475.1 transcriptional regulator [Myxococcaceae bacterium]